MGGWGDRGLLGVQGSGGDKGMFEGGHKGICGVMWGDGGRWGHHGMKGCGGAMGG